MAVVTKSGEPVGGAVKAVAVGTAPGKAVCTVASPRPAPILLHPAALSRGLGLPRVAGEPNSPTAGGDDGGVKVPLEVAGANIGQGFAAAILGAEAEEEAEVDAEAEQASRCWRM
mmetsp:Transcript_1531/g.3691  ORF Transcript_1531/g.3691 Transcript_1531/m.3691 type:complete len:115 (-) Transcript_1531:82-426(-)